MSEIKIMSVVKPRGRRNPVKWFVKNNVSSNIYSYDIGVMKFIDSLHRND